jgi:hypothetical protein
MSADFSQYIDLTIYDAEPTALYRSSVDSARLVLPEFILRQGTVEDALFQAFSYTSAIIANSINRLPSRLMEGLVSMVGYERSIGSKSTAILTVTLYGYDAMTIPAGTQFRWRYILPGTSSYEDYVFEAIEDTAIASTTPPATPSASVSVQCTQAGQIPALTTGDILLPLSIDTDINAVTVLSFVNGVSPMGDGEYLDAALTYMESLTETFSTAKQLQSAILTSFINVRRCKVYDVTNSLSSATTAASAAPGYISIYAYGNGASLTNAELSEIQTWAANRCIAGITITVANFTLSSPTVAINAVFNSKYTASDVVGEIKTLVAAYYNFSSWPQEELSVSSPQIRTNSIASIISQMPEVLYVNSVTLTPPVAKTISAIATGNSLSGSATGYIKFTSTAHGFVAGQEVDITTNINTITITAVDDGANLAGTPTSGSIRFAASNSLTPGDIVTITTSSGAFDFTRAVVTARDTDYFTIASTVTGLTTTGTAYYDFTNSIIVAANADNFVIANTCIATTTSKTGSAYLHFDGTNSQSTTSLVFKNKGFLPNISSSDVTVTYSLEAI